MKKFTKILSITLASFTLLTGCKGKELTASEAKDVIKSIAEKQSSVYDEETAWTITTVLNGTVDGEKDEVAGYFYFDLDKNLLKAFFGNYGEYEQADEEFLTQFD